MKPILLFPLVASLALVACNDTKPLEDENTKLKAELRDTKRDLASAKRKANSAESKHEQVDAGVTPPVASDGILEAKSDYWCRLAAASAKPAPFIRRAIADGVNDPYFVREAPKVGEELAKIRSEGEALQEEWKKSGSPKAAQQIRGIVEISKALVQVEDQLRSAPSLSYEEKSKAKVESLAQNGVENVPEAVMNSIIERAKRNTPEVFMESTIKDEAGAYLKVEKFKTDEGIPAAIRDKIVARASRKSPDNWGPMWDEMNRQADGFRIIARWETEGAPGLSKEKTLDLIKKAKETYPDDWNMIHFEVSRTADRAE